MWVSAQNGITWHLDIELDGNMYRALPKVSHLTSPWNEHSHSSLQGTVTGWIPMNYFLTGHLSWDQTTQVHTLQPSSLGLTYSNYLKLKLMSQHNLKIAFLLGRLWKVHEHHGLKVVMSALPDAPADHEAGMQLGLGHPRYNRDLNSKHGNFVGIWWILFGPAQDSCQKDIRFFRLPILPSGELFAHAAPAAGAFTGFSCRVLVATI